PIRGGQLTSRMVTRRGASGKGGKKRRLTNPNPDKLPRQPLSSGGWGAKIPVYQMMWIQLTTPPFSHHQRRPRCANSRATASADPDQAHAVPLGVVCKGSRKG